MTGALASARIVSRTSPLTISMSPVRNRSVLAKTDPAASDKSSPAPAELRLIVVLVPRVSLPKQE
jgi:hypothetical protein